MRGANLEAWPLHVWLRKASSKRWSAAQLARIAPAPSPLRVVAVCLRRSPRGAKQGPQASNWTRAIFSRVMARAVLVGGLFALDLASKIRFHLSTKV